MASFFSVGFTCCFFVVEGVALFGRRAGSCSCRRAFEESTVVSAADVCSGVCVGVSWMREVVVRSEGIG